MPIIELAAAFLIKTAKDSFHDWAKKEGVGMIDGLAKMHPFSLFGKRSAIRNQLWDEVSHQVQQPSLGAAIDLEAAEYLRLPGLICDHSDNLPEQSTPYPLKNVKALPRRAINEAAMTRLKKGIGNAQLVRDQTQSSILIDYFLTDIVREFERQYSKAYRGRSPVKVSEARETAGDWVVIALDSAYPWPTPDSPGHYLLYHDKLAGFKKLGRSEKNELEKQMTNLEGKLGALSATDKDALVKSIVFRTESKYSSNPVQWKMV